MPSELIPFIVNEVPHAARDLKESLDLLSGSIQGCLAQLGEQLLDAHQRADYKRSIEISQQSEKIKKNWESDSTNRIPIRWRLR